MTGITLLQTPPPWIIHCRTRSHRRGRSQNPPGLQHSNQGPKSSTNAPTPGSTQIPDTNEQLPNAPLRAAILASIGFPDNPYLNLSSPEAIARQEIDAQLSAAGWTVQDLDALNLLAVNQAIATNPAFRDLLEKKRRDREVTIDHFSSDEIIAGGDEEEKARQLVTSWKTFLEHNQDDYLDAWQSVDSRQADPLAVAGEILGKDQLKPIIEELNEALIA
jgi:hypothetical protein